jgi:hypothetical protein
MGHVQSDSEAERPPLLIKFTGYRLLTIVITLAFGVPKVIKKVKGETLTDLDWEIGIILAIA